MTKTPSRFLLRIAACGLLLGALPALTGCASKVGTISFRCGAQINGGLALAVDVIRATEEESRKIQEMGEKWFYDQTRFNWGGGGSSTAPDDREDERVLIGRVQAAF